MVLKQLTSLPKRLSRFMTLRGFMFCLFIYATCLTTPCQEREPLFPIEQNDRWGYIDSSGRIAIEPRFDYADEFSEGLAVVQVGERWGFIDTAGKLVIEPRYSGAYSFSEGLARVQVGGDKYQYYGKWGFIDRNGAMVIEPQFAELMSSEESYSFHDGFAMIEVNGLHGFIDKKGNTVIAPRFAYAYPFSEGLAGVSEGLDTKWGYIDTTGRWAIPPKFESASLFTGGLAPVELNGGVCGYVDRSGELKVRPKFKMKRDDDCAVAWGSFDDGLSRWKIGDKYGYINKAGEVVIKPAFDLTFNFSEGLAFVELNGKYGFIDQTGRMAIEPQFYFVKDFHNGLALVEYARGSSAYINKRGEFVWKKGAAAVPTGEVNAFLQTGHTRDILFVGWSADGNLLASYSGGDGRIKIWNAKTGKLIWDIEATDLGPYPFKSRDGKLLAAQINDHFEIRDAQTQQLLWTITQGSASPNRVTSPDGLTVAERGSYGDACVTLFDARTNEAKNRLEGHPGIVFAVAYSPDGKLIASGSSDKSIRFWDAKTGALLKTLLGHSQKVTSLAFSTDGKTLVSGGEDDMLRVWNVSDGSLVRTITGYTTGVDEIVSVTLSPDAKIAAAGSRDEIKLWDIGTGQQVGALKTDESDVRSVKFNPDGTLLVSVHEGGTIRLWDVRSLKLIRGFKGRFPDLYAAVFTPDGKFVAAGYNESDSRVDFWSVRTGRFSGSLAVDSDYVKSLAFSRDGTMIATGHMSDAVKVWNVRTKKLIREFHQPFSEDDKVAFSPDGRYVVSGGENQNVMLWDVRTGQLVWSAVQIDWEAEKRSQLASQQRMAAAAAAEADKRNLTVTADKETAAWRDPVTVSFDHYGEPINPLEQRMAEKGTANKSLTVQTSSEATGVWLRLKNNSPLPITFGTDSFYLPRPGCGVKLSNGSSGPGVCEGAEISVRYQIEESNRKPVPYGGDFYSMSVLPPGGAILFSVRKDHLTNGRTVFVTYTYLKENEKHELAEYGTAHRVAFRSSQLRE